MDLIFERSGENPLCVEVGYFDTVLEIKEKIQKVQGIPISEQTLIFNGNVLRDDLNVHYSDILHRSRIQLVVADFPSPKRLEEKIQGNASVSGLRVVAQYGAEKIPMEVSAEDNVGELRKKLQKMKVNVPQEGYFFIYKQIVMDDDRSFKWHRVAQGDTIHICTDSTSDST